MGCLRCDVTACLAALCEGKGVSDNNQGDIEVLLSDASLWIRLEDEPAVVTLYRNVPEDIPVGLVNDDPIHAFNASHTIFRAFRESESVVLRADILGEPFAPQHLQSAIESFDAAMLDLVEALSDVL